MSNFTRRALLGGSGAIVGLAACQAETMPGTDETTDTMTAPRPYPGRVRFEHGVASGDPLSDRVIIWTRITPEAPVQSTPIPVRARLYHDAALDSPAGEWQAIAKSSTDFTVKIDADGLIPGQTYYYRFEALTETGAIASPVGRTKTTTKTGHDPVRLAVISCSHFGFGHFHSYRDISKDKTLDAVIHLGDYIYEYGLGPDDDPSYGAESGRALGRTHEPTHEIITLSDYRTRHAQYKRDRDLQSAHAAAPWICNWDDHESANDSYRTGADNHNPENGEGKWSERKQNAVQAYFEWMPIREPQAGAVRDTIYRRFEFGDLASLICLETRLTGRSEEISWSKELGDLDDAQVPFAAVSTMLKVRDPDRTMLGPVQERWLSEQLERSTRTGKIWQVLANQVIMAKVRAPDLNRTLTPGQIRAQDGSEVAPLIPFSRLGLPWNLDAWDGFPAARDRLYAAAKNANAKLVTLTGDTHTAWANTLLDNNRQQRGVEFGCTSVTSPGMGEYFRNVDNLGQQFADANEEVEWHKTTGQGWTLITLTRDAVRADFWQVSDVRQPDYSSAKIKSFEVRLTDGKIGPLAEL